MTIRPEICGRTVLFPALESYFDAPLRKMLTRSQNVGVWMLINKKKRENSLGLSAVAIAEAMRDDTPGEGSSRGAGCA